MDKCQRCDGSIFIEDNNGFDVCSGCGLVNSFDRLCDAKIYQKEEKEKHSVYDIGDHVSIDGVASYINTVNIHYIRKSKYFIEFISNYTINPFYELDEELLSSIYVSFRDFKNENKKKTLLQNFIKSPTKRNTFQILRSITLPYKIKKKYTSRITKKTLNIIKRKNIIMKWNLIRLYLISKFNVKCDYKLLPNNLGDILIFMFRFFIADIFTIISRKNRISSPNLVVTSLCFLFLLNPKFILIYGSIFDSPSNKTFEKNINYINTIIKYKYRSIDEYRNIMLSNIPYHIQKDEYIKNNILDINFKEKCSQINLIEHQQITSLKMIIKILGTEI